MGDLLQDKANDVWLETAGCAWLRYERQCKLVCTERSVFQDPYRPDILGVTVGRRLIEIEVKRSVSDFNANAKKTHNDLKYLSQFYFLVPPRMVPKVRDAIILMPDCGLLTLGNGWFGDCPILEVVIACKAKRGDRLPWDLLVRMAAHQTGTLITAMTSNARERHRALKPPGA